MQSRIRSCSWCVALLCAATGAAARAVVPEPAQLVAHGDCTGALRAAHERVAVAGQKAGDPVTVIAMLAQYSRVALDCQRPDEDGLIDALQHERRLRARVPDPTGAAAAELDLREAERAAQLNQVDKALGAVQALREQPSFTRWPRLLRARVLAQLASLHNQRADAQAALENAAAAAALARRDAAAEPSVLIAALQDQAFALTRMRQGAKALAPAGEAEALARRRYGANSRQHANALRFVAYAQRDAGDFGAAIGTFEQALAAQNAQVEIDRHQVAVLELNLGQTLKISGDGARAQTYYERALDTDAQAADPSGRLRPAIVHGLANLYRDRNDSERALPLYAQAVALFTQVFGEHSVQLAQVLNNYANALGNLGRYDEAAPVYQRALAIARERNSADPADYTPLVNLAMLDVWQARYAAAEPAFREMLQRLRGASLAGEAGVLFARLGLAASLWGQGRLDDAFAAAVDAERTRQAALRLAMSHLGEEHAIDLQEYQRPTLDFVLAIAIAGGQRERLQRAWELSMAARGQVTAQIAQRLAAARAADDPTLAPLWRAWREASAAIARVELDDEADGAARRDAQDALDRAERALAAGAERIMTRAADRGAARLGDVAAALPRDAVLVLYVTVQPRSASDFAKTEAEQRSPDLYALVLGGHQADVRAFKLGSLAEAGARIDAWNAALADPASALATVSARGRAVRELVWDPLHPALTGKRVLMIPTGALFRVPWAALPDRDGFLIDAGWTLHVIDHERELLAAPLTTSAHLLAIADPAPLPRLPRADGCPDGAVLPALPGARLEVERLAALWRKNAASAAAAQTLVGAEASESRVRAASAGAAVLHFATHSIGAGGGGCAVAATRGFALVADAPAADGAAPAAAATALALGAGDPARGDDDGLLGAEEIAMLDLSRVRWAVLAACATAAGAIRHYEGLSGLSRAFRLAGARTVITSLWPVDDAATAQWSEALYRARVVQGLDTAASMREAQRSVLAQRRSRGESTHPYYWAAFVAAGDWR